MPPKPLPTDLPMYSFPTAKDLESFYDREHETIPGFYLKLARKASGIPSVSSADAIETALCFGWIDGQGGSYDDDFYTVRYTPRRAKSLWSQKNVNTVARLVEEGRMRPAGVAAVDAAKADGRWERAYAGPATITIPDDFATALACEPAASALFDKLNKTERYSILFRVHTAAPENRQKRIATLVQSLVDDQRPKIWKKETAKPGVKAEKAADKKTIKRVGKIGPVTKPAAARRKSANVPIVNEQQNHPTRRPGLRPRP